MKPEPSQTKGKQAYAPPKLLAVCLRPEEAVLGHCKNATAAGPVQATCTAIVPCGSVGS